MHDIWLWLFCVDPMVLVLVERDMHIHIVPTFFLLRINNSLIVSSPLEVFFFTAANSPASCRLLKNAEPKPFIRKRSSMLWNGPKLSRYCTREVALLFPMPLVFESSSKLRLLSSFKISCKLALKWVLTHDIQYLQKYFVKISVLKHFLSNSK